jgi:short-subunit dehydrogenase
MSSEVITISLGRYCTGTSALLLNGFYSSTKAYVVNFTQALIRAFGCGF